jgi:hypothetical protein
MLGLLSRPSATLSSIADGGEGRGEEVLSFIESVHSTILRFMEWRCSSKSNLRAKVVLDAEAIGLSGPFLMYE